MDAISVADIESWLDSFDKPGAARKAYAVFRAILRLAFKRGLADNDVTRREIRLPRLRHYEPQATGVRVRRIAPLRVGRLGMGRLGSASRHRHCEKVGAVGGRP